MSVEAIAGEVGAPGAPHPVTSAVISRYLQAAANSRISADVDENQLIVADIIKWLLPSYFACVCLSRLN